MAQDQITQLLQQGIAAARENRPDIARGMFQRVLTADPRNEVAWAWLASIARDNNERLIFLKKLWEVNPQNEFALKGLRALGVDPGAEAAASPAPAAQSSVPYLDDARFARVQQAADDFLQRYTPQPPDHLSISWERRHRNRYGERGAQRLRQVMYAAAGLAFIVVVGLVIAVIAQVDLPGGGDGREFATRVPTRVAAATFTPTPGGPTPTPLGENTLVFEPTTIPSGLVAGQAFGVSSPTPLVPRPDVNVERVVERALGHYAIGDYETAADILSQERERSDPDCYASVVYYEALSYAQMGEFTRAENLLDWAVSYEPPQRLNESCQGSPLLPAGFAQVLYMQDPESEAALEYSEQALDADEDMVDAALTKARIQLARGQVAEAWQTANQARQERPQDTNVLLVLADIELANNQPETALEYIGQALYVDPDLLPALYRQADAYLMLARQSSANRERRVQAYGFAVRSAQWILQYYEGDPQGYLYLALARIGEGNDDLAETALNRILAVEDRLPESADPVIDNAYRIRGELFFQQGEFDRALDDLNTYASRVDMPGTDAVEMLVKSALDESDYSLALSWIAQLLNVQPDNADYLLWQAQLWVEVCTFHTGEIACRYDDMLALLSDAFISGFPNDSQRAQAYSYRAQAQYHTVQQQAAALTDSQREAALQQVLDDLTQALSVRDSSLDHYYRGLTFEALEQPLRAFEEYQLVDYWGATYTYPFMSGLFETRFAAVANAVQESMADVVVTVEPPTPPPATPTPQITATATESATQTTEDDVDVTATPRAADTATATPEPDTAQGTPAPANIP